MPKLGLAYLLTLAVFCQPFVSQIYVSDQFAEFLKYFVFSVLNLINVSLISVPWCFIATILWFQSQKYMNQPTCLRKIFNYSTTNWQHSQQS